MAGQGKAWQGWAGRGMVHGKAWQGSARRGWARHGSWYGIQSGCHKI